MILVLRSNRLRLEVCETIFENSLIVHICNIQQPPSTIVTRYRRCGPSDLLDILPVPVVRSWLQGFKIDRIRSPVLWLYQWVNVLVAECVAE